MLNCVEFFFNIIVYSLKLYFKIEGRFDGLISFFKNCIEFYE